MPDLPVAETFAVQLCGEGPSRFSVRCPFCHQIHAHQWFGRDGRFDVTAPCSTDMEVRRYRVDLTTVPKRNVTQPHTVHAAGSDRDDNAFDVPEPNWIE